jgi:hypothetical protein
MPRLHFGKVIFRCGHCSAYKGKKRDEPQWGRVGNVAAPTVTLDGMPLALDETIEDVRDDLSLA